MNPVTLQSCSPRLFSQYHNWVWKKERYTVTSIALAIITLLPVSYLITGVLSLIGRITHCCTSADDREQKQPLISERAPQMTGAQLRIEIDALHEANLPGWQQQAMDKIRKARREDPNEELQRLREAGILTQEAEDKLDRKHLKLETKVLFAQALEIQHVFKDTHYVFLHGQPSECIYLPHLLKALAKNSDPDQAQTLKQFKVLRSPQVSAPHWKDKYRNLVIGYPDITREGCQELLSVDACFYNSQKRESALDFVDQNARTKRRHPEIATDVLQQAFPQASPDDIEHSVNAIQSSVPDDASCGNLFVVCIPKEQLEKTSYRAHPFGVSCNCKHKADVLDKLQAGETISCGRNIIPQYRLYMPEVTPGEGRHSYLLTPAKKAARKQLKREINAQIANLSTQIPQRLRACERSGNNGISHRHRARKAF